MRLDTAKIDAAAEMLIDMHGERAVQYVEAQVDDACRIGDGMGSVAWSVIGAALRRRLDRAATDHDPQRRAEISL